MEQQMTNIVAGLAMTFLSVPEPAVHRSENSDQIEKLAASAKETGNITRDGPLLQLAGQGLNSKNADDQRVKNIIARVKAIHVRTFEFDRAGEYSEGDVAAYRSQLRSPAWSRIVDTVNREDREHVEVFVKQEKGQVAGVAIIAAEPKELTIVNIDGTIDPHSWPPSGSSGFKIDASAGH